MRGAAANDESGRLPAGDGDRHRFQIDPGRAGGAANRRHGRQIVDREPFHAEVGVQRRHLGRAVARRERQSSRGPRYDAVAKVLDTPGVGARRRLRRPVAPEVVDFDVAGGDGGDAARGGGQIIDGGGPGQAQITQIRAERRYRKATIGVAAVPRQQRERIPVIDRRGHIHHRPRFEDDLGVADGVASLARDERCLHRQAAQRQSLFRGVEAGCSGQVPGHDQRAGAGGHRDIRLAEGAVGRELERDRPLQRRIDRRQRSEIGRQAGERRGPKSGEVEVTVHRIVGAGRTQLQRHRGVRARVGKSERGAATQGGCPVARELRLVDPHAQVLGRGRPHHVHRHVVEVYVGQETQGSAGVGWRAKTGQRIDEKLPVPVLAALAWRRRPETLRAAAEGDRDTGRLHGGGREDAARHRLGAERDGDIPDAGQQRILAAVYLDVVEVDEQAAPPILPQHPGVADMEVVLRGSLESPLDYRREQAQRQRTRAQACSKQREHDDGERDESGQQTDEDMNNACQFAAIPVVVHGVGKGRRDPSAESAFIVKR